MCLSRPFALLPATSAELSLMTLICGEVDPFFPDVCGSGGLLTATPGARLCLVARVRDILRLPPVVNQIERSLGASAAGSDAVATIRFGELPISPGVLDTKALVSTALTYQDRGARRFGSRLPLAGMESECALPFAKDVLEHARGSLEPALSR
jgi:hypothetical protein